MAIEKNVGPAHLGRLMASQVLRERLEQAIPPEEAVQRLLVLMGEDPLREGLRDTPARVVRAWQEMCAGYDQDPAQLLETTFQPDDQHHEEGPDVIRYGGIVLLRDIPFTSTCEHHLLPFLGTAHLAYIPGEDGRVVGISKLARLLDAFARRLQVQERLTAQVADAIQQHLHPRGVLVVLTAVHACMRIRGVRKASGDMVTSEVRGLFKDNDSARAEALRLALGH